jgi:DNA repair exonuclease SbcCD ATPase subunit
MILLESIHLKNFLSHADTSVVFKENQRLLIDGVSGSGKSSIVEALVWCLYNKGRADNRDLIHKGAKSMTVTVMLQYQENVFCKIERHATVDGKHELKVFSNEGASWKPLQIAGIKSLQEYIETEILHSSYLLFVNSVVYPQNNEDSFIKQTAANRKDILLEMANVSAMEEYLKRTKLLISAKSDNCKRLEGSTESLNSWIEQSKSTLGDASDVQRSLYTIQESIDALEARKGRNDAFLKEHDGLLMVVKTIPEEIKNLQDAIADIGTTNPQDEIDGLEAEYDAHVKRYKTWEKKNKELFDKCFPLDLSDIEDQIRSINQSLATILASSGKGDWTCPQCKLVTPLSHICNNQEATIQELESLLKKTNKKREEIVKNNVTYEKGVLALGDKPKEPVLNKTRISQLHDQLVTYRALPIFKDRIGDLQKKLDELLKKIKSLEDLIVPDLDANIADLKTKDAVYTSQLQGIKERTDEIEKATKKYIVEKKMLEELNEEREQLHLLRDAFSPNGITAIVIDFLVPQLESRVNNILQKLSDFRVRFDTQKKGLGKETTLEGLFITVINDQGKELDFDLYSGGEKLRIIVAISEALSEVQQIGFRILDEAFIGLDQESIEGFVEVIEELSDRFSQLICISHLQDIKDTFDEKILITKNNGISIIN